MIQQSTNSTSANAVIISMGNAANDAPALFEAGKQYKHNFVGDSDLWVTYKVVRRTAKSVWIQKVQNGAASGEVFRRAISTCPIEGSEHCAPVGNYSMAPTLRAQKKA